MLPCADVSTAMRGEKLFLGGVIEGFYGPPWSRGERFQLFDWLAAWGLNSYLYAPKDDLKQRALWRENYTASELGEFRHLIEGCDSRGLIFFHALSPGLDIQYSSRGDLEALKRRWSQMMEAGCRNFCLLFDDIPDRMAGEDLREFGSLAAAQCSIANQVYRWIEERVGSARFLFCPTPYCGRMAQAQLGGEGYLKRIGRELAEGIEIFWTGPEIISEEITPEHLREMRRVLGRKPLIWDNLHANDYDGRRFFCGPFSGRSPGSREETSGIMLNPNTEFPLNFMAVRTLARFLEREGGWDPREAYLEALKEWLPRFATASAPVTLEELAGFMDCFYLPHEEGREAREMWEQVRGLLARHPAHWGAAAAEFVRRAERLQGVCARLPELVDRPLFHALSRRVWDLREELDLLGKYVAFKAKPENYERPFRSDFHLPGTFRGGLIARMQGLLMQEPDGSFHPGAR